MSLVRHFFVVVVVFTGFCFAENENYVVVGASLWWNWRFVLALELLQWLWCVLCDSILGGFGGLVWCWFSPFHIYTTLVLCSFFSPVSIHLELADT
jgi:hypothetical protein